MSCGRKNVDYDSTVAAATVAPSKDGTPRQDSTVA
jgi:hypothetical protein